MLSNFEINKAKKILNEIIDSTKSLREFNKIKDLVEDDENLSMFFHETTIGNDLYIKLFELVDLVVNDLYNELDTLNSYTYDYLNSRYNSINDKS